MNMTIAKLKHFTDHPEEFLATFFEVKPVKSEVESVKPEAKPVKPEAKSVKSEAKSVKPEPPQMLQIPQMESGVPLTLKLLRTIFPDIPDSLQGTLLPQKKKTAYPVLEPGFRECIRDAFRKCFGICALSFALDAPQGAPRQSPMCICSKPLRNPPEANRGIRVEKLVLELCAWRPLNTDQLAFLLGRNRNYVTNRLITPMLRRHLLQMSIPQHPKHPNQSYQTSVEKH
jgi:hypothetical protein